MLQGDYKPDQNIRLLTHSLLRNGLSSVLEKKEFNELLAQIGYYSVWYDEKTEGIPPVEKLLVLLHLLSLNDTQRFLVFAMKVIQVIIDQKYSVNLLELKNRICAVNSVKKDQNITLNTFFEQFGLSEEQQIVGTRDISFQYELYRLKIYYSMLITFLDNYFSEGAVMRDNYGNLHYLKICREIKKIISGESFEDLQEYKWKPFENLRVIEMDDPSFDWEYYGKETCEAFMSLIEEHYIENGELSFLLPEQDVKFLNNLHAYNMETRKIKKKQLESTLGINDKPVKQKRVEEKQLEEMTNSTLSSLESVLINNIYDHILKNPSISPSRSVSPQKRALVIERDKCTCQICEEDLVDDEIEIDHIFPYSYGGSSNVTNLMVLCKRCNRDKTNRLEYYQSDEGRKKLLVNIQVFVRSLDLIQDFNTWLMKTSRRSKSRGETMDK